jgi:hypothetical protein
VAKLFKNCRATEEDEEEEEEEERIDGIKCRKDQEEACSIPI